MDGVVTGPAYRTFDPHKGRWVAGREACIDALVRKAMDRGPSHCFADQIEQAMKAWWPRAVFR